MNKKQLKKLIQIIEGVEYGKIIIHKQGGLNKL